MAEIIINIAGVKVRRLYHEHIDGIIKLMNKEGWYYYDHHELKRYLTLNQECFILFKDGNIIGSIFTTNYGNQAWIGNIIVAKKERGIGLASKLITGVIDYLRDNEHVPTFRIGSVPLAIGLYKKLGFRAEAFTTAQEVGLPLNAEYEEINLGKNMQIERLYVNDLEAIGKIDERYFKSKRLQFLKEIFNDSIKEGSFCLKDQGKVVGFLMLRRRLASKSEGHFAEGPDYVYRLGPSSFLPKYGINGFKALFKEVMQVVNKEVLKLGGSAKMYAAFPKNADKEEVYKDTRELAKVMGMDANMNLDNIFDEHEHIFGAQKFVNSHEQWKYMESLGFRQEYFEQVMSYTPGETVNTPPGQRNAEKTKADLEGIFASATPGDKA